MLGFLPQTLLALVAQPQSHVLVLIARTTQWLPQHTGKGDSRSLLCHAPLTS